MSPLASVMGKIKLLDIKFPPRFLKEFPRPKFGLSGIRFERNYFLKAAGLEKSKHLVVKNILLVKPK